MSKPERLDEFENKTGPEDNPTSGTFEGTEYSFNLGISSTALEATNTETGESSMISC